MRGILIIESTGATSRLLATLAASRTVAELRPPAQVVHPPVLELKAEPKPEFPSDALTNCDTNYPRRAPVLKGNAKEYGMSRRRVRR